MTKCAFCGKEISAVLDLKEGGYRINTKYWRVKDGETQYFCDAKCSLDLHEKERKENDT